VKSTLKPTETRDTSKPVIESDVHIFQNEHKALLAEIEQEHDLNHVNTEHDASVPVIDSDIQIKEAPQVRVLEEVVQPHVLKHVVVNDKSAPALPLRIKMIE